jgi:CheY-like chemotaxis protein
MPCPKASPTANPIVIPDNPRRILVAEDISATRKQYTNTLNRYGYAVAAVANGQDAVDYYQASTASDKPFLLIIMDTEMPVLNGPGATSAIRAFEKAQEKPAIPIIALTGNTMASDIAICEAAGATAVLTKPIRLEQLLAALRSLLPKEPPMRESDDAKYSPMSVATTRVSGVDTDNSEPSSPTSSTSETALLLRSPVPPFRSGAAKKPSISSSPDALMGGSQHLHLRERDPNDDRTNEESLATSSSAPPG